MTKQEKDQLTREQALRMLRAAAEGIVEACRVDPENGAPAGALYNALSAHGMSLAVFEQIVSGLVAAGAIRRGSLPHHYVAVPRSGDAATEVVRRPGPASGPRRQS